jgi:zinc protease
MKRNFAIIISIVGVICIAVVLFNNTLQDKLNLAPVQSIISDLGSYPKTETQGELLEIQSIETAKGIKIWLSEDHSLPIVTLNFRFLQAGATYDAPEKQGATQVLSNTLDEGAGELDSTAFQRELQNNSISLSFQNSRDTFGGSLKTLTRHTDKAFKLLKLAITEPRFDEEPVARMVAANRSRIKSSLSNPSWKAARIMNDKAYEGHPYSLNSGGTLSTLETITADDLRQIMKERFNRKNLVITAAGDITAKELSKKVDAIFGDLPLETERPDLSHINVQNGGKIYVYNEDIPQSIIVMKQDGVRRSDPDYYAATLMNMILGGGGFGSRLMEEAREVRGLTYGIYSQLNDSRYSESFVVQTSTKNETAQEMVTLIQDEIRKIASEGVTEQELMDTKSYLIGSMPLNLVSNSQISSVLLSIRLDELPLTYLDDRETLINAVTSEDIQVIANKMLTAENITTVIIGNPVLDAEFETLETLPNVD